MSGFENMTLGDFGITFPTVDTFIEEQKDQQDSQVFGPSKNQLKDFDAWEGCDGKFFQPYNNRQKIGKISDFVTAAVHLAREQERELDKNEYQKKKDAEQAAYKQEKRAKLGKAAKEEAKTKAGDVEEEDEDGFTTIEDKNIKPNNKKQQQNQWQNNRGRGGYQNWRGRGAHTQPKGFGVSGQQLKAKSKKDKSRQNYYLSNMIKQLRCNLRDNSIDVKPEWELVGEFTKQSFDRLPSLRPVSLPNLKECGEVSAYDISWDRSSAKKPKAIKKFSGKSFDESLFDDEVMVELIENDVADIFTTDVIAAALMCATKSNYSWDVEIKKYGNKIFIDKRQDDEIENNILNFHTVAETAVEHQPMDDTSINGIKQLMREAKSINDSFMQQSQSSDVAKQIQLDGENPFVEDESQVCIRQGYIYRIWRIQEANAAEGKSEKKICIRCSIHSHSGVAKENGEMQTMNLYTFNEFNLNMTNWRSKIDASLITCLNKEITDNSFKASRWLVQAILADVDLIKFAFVSRKEMVFNNKHVILGTHTVGTQNFAKQLNVQMDQMWSNIKHIVDVVEKQAEQKAEGAEKEEEEESELSEYILLKDFNRLAFRLYKKDLEEDEGEEEEAAAK